jgi:hypothetical protein
MSSYAPVAEQSLEARGAGAEGRKQTCAGPASNAKRELLPPRIIIVASAPAAGSAPLQGWRALRLPVGRPPAGRNRRRCLRHPWSPPSPFYLPGKYSSYAASRIHATL